MTKKTLKDWLKILADHSLDIRGGITEIAGHLLEVEKARAELESVRMSAITAWVRQLREDGLLTSEHATALVQQWLIESRAETATRAKGVADLLAAAPSVLNAILPVVMSQQSWLKDLFTERN